MAGFNNSYIGLRSDLLKFIPNGQHVVLDVGCATGVNGQFLLDNGKVSSVTGIEFDADMAKIAAKTNSKVLCGDLNQDIFIKSILDLDEQYDFILFGDILEHLYNPQHVLATLKQKLKPKGKIIISLPNVGHLELFIQVYIKGTWPQNPRGIFDATHLRWFTRKDAFSLVSNSKLKVVSYERKYRSRDAIGSKFKWPYKVLRKINKDWVTFQHIIVCEHE
ncbi:class I SAM-dependent methyltransferase [Tamlana sp. I1]|uniref:class I SAM-dependent methyltransferase n=1 Tax=Tamlana sp. I1 TaxID=2762061 RepID=UPI00188FDCD2|nr:class I SAM-dependent methyltransferase [Tamlana sp. I1]